MNNTQSLEENVELSEYCRELKKLKAKLSAADELRLSGYNVYTLDESRSRLERQFSSGKDD